MFAGFLRRFVRERVAALRPDPLPDAERQLASRMDRVAQRLGRSLAVLHVGAGSCNGCEVEIRALGGLVYDLERFGLRFVDSPRQADVLLVTGPVTHAMHAALVRAWQGAGEPKWVVACGGCAIDGGLFRGGYAVAGGVDQVLPVDLRIPGCPPAPAEILAGLLALLDCADGATGSAVGDRPREEGMPDIAQEAVEAARVPGGIGIHEAHGGGEVLAAPAQRGPDGDLGR